MTAPAPSPAEQAVIDRFGIFDEERIVEESVDLTPGVVWTNAQLEVVRHLVARLNKAEQTVAAYVPLLAEVRRGRALRERLEGLAEQWLASSVLGLSALAGAGRELRRALAALDES